MQWQQWATLFAVKRLRIGQQAYLKILPCRKVRNIFFFVFNTFLFYYFNNKHLKDFKN